MGILNKSFLGGVFKGSSYHLSGFFNELSFRILKLLIKLTSFGMLVAITSRNGNCIDIFLTESFAG